MNTDNEKQGLTPSDPGPEIIPQQDDTLDDQVSAKVEIWESHRICLWNSQEEFLKQRFGDKLKWANYGWGSCCTSEGAAESTKICAEGKVYILRSLSRSESRAAVMHELFEF